MAYEIPIRYFPVTLVKVLPARDKYRMILDSAKRYGLVSRVLHGAMGLLILWQLLKFFDRIAEVRPGRGGEIQLTDALRVQAESGPFHGVLTRTRRYDTGNPLGWLTAVVELALDDPRIGTDFRSWLRTIV